MHVDEQSATHFRTYFGGDWVRFGFPMAIYQNVCSSPATAAQDPEAGRLVRSETHRGGPRDCAPGTLLSQRRIPGSILSFF